MVRNRDFSYNIKVFKEFTITDTIVAAALDAFVHYFPQYQGMQRNSANLKPWLMLIIIEALQFTDCSCIQLKARCTLI